MCTGKACHAASIQKQLLTYTSHRAILRVDVPINLFVFGDRAVAFPLFMERVTYYVYGNMEMVSGHSKPCLNIATHATLQYISERAGRSTTGRPYRPGMQDLEHHTARPAA